MLIKKFGKTTVKVVFLALFVLGSVGCTKYASQDDLKTLKESEQAAISAEKQKDKVIAERMALEKELSAKQQELTDAESELEHVKNAPK